MIFTAGWLGITPDIIYDCMLPPELNQAAAKDICDQQSSMPSPFGEAGYVSQGALPPVNT